MSLLSSSLSIVLFMFCDHSCEVQIGKVNENMTLMWFEGELVVWLTSEHISSRSWSMRTKVWSVVATSEMAGLQQSLLNPSFVESLKHRIFYII